MLVYSALIDLAYANISDVIESYKPPLHSPIN